MFKQDSISIRTIVSLIIALSLSMFLNPIAYCQHLTGFEVIIEEKPVSGYVVGTIETSIDKDSLIFKIKSQIPDRAFLIDSIIGKITVRDSSLFNYKINPVLTAVVQIKNGKITNDINVTVRLVKLSEFITFVDKNFKTALLAHKPTIDVNNDKEISTNEASIVNELDVSNKKISDFSEIKYFINLTTIKCSENQIISLDLSRNTFLENLHCDKNQLTILNINENTNLEFISCRKNKLLSLDVSNNHGLEYLNCDENQISYLDVSKNTILKDFSCEENKLKSLDISKNIILEEFECDNNQLSSLDISKNINLERLKCNYNQITILDVSILKFLRSFSCSNNKLTSLDVSNNLALELLICDINKLESLDVSNNIALKTLFCERNQINSLDLSKNAALDYLMCRRNKLEYLNLKNGNNSFFRIVRISENPLLKCVQVDDYKAAYLEIWRKDDQTKFAKKCKN